MINVIDDFVINDLQAAMKSGELRVQTIERPINGLILLVTLSCFKNFDGKFSVSSSTVCLPEEQRRKTKKERAEK